MSAESEKQLAAEAAAEMIEAGMRVGLGTGSTTAYFLTALARRGLDVTCVATSPRTADAARAAGLRVVDFSALDRLDVAVDGADQIAPSGWLLKGRGGAHTREKVVAAAADRFVVIADATKVVDALDAPVPLELLRFALASTLRRLGVARVRDDADTPDGGVLADFHGPVGDPAETAARLSATPGVVGHGLFAPSLVTTVLVGRGTRVERGVGGLPS